MNRRMICRAAMLAAVTGLGLAAPQRAQAAFALELGLVVDVSGSVDTTEFNLQRNAYASAFQSSEIQSLVENSPGGIRVWLVYFASTAQLTIAPTVLTTAQHAIDFGTAIANAARPSSSVVGGTTGIGNGIQTAFNQFTFNSAAQILDVSGDGQENVSTTGLANARAAAVNAGVRINGLAIGNEALRVYFENFVIGGAGSFAVRTENFDQLSAAIQNKLVTEITDAVVPEPSTFAGGCIGVVMLAGLIGRRRLMKRPAA